MKIDRFKIFENNIIITVFSEYFDSKINIEQFNI